MGSQSRAAGYARYAHVANDLRAAILAGRFPPGTRLPSERALAGEFGVSRGTIVSALHVIRGEGLIETRRGVGSCVASLIDSGWMLKVGHGAGGPIS